MLGEVPSSAWRQLSSRPLQHKRELRLICISVSCLSSFVTDRKSFSPREVFSCQSSRDLKQQKVIQAWGATCEANKYLFWKLLRVLRTFASTFHLTRAWSVRNSIKVWWRSKQCSRGMFGRWLDNSKKFYICFSSDHLCRRRKWEKSRRARKKHKISDKNAERFPIEASVKIFYLVLSYFLDSITDTNK